MEVVPADLVRLQVGEFLNDTIIDFYMRCAPSCQSNTVDVYIHLGCWWQAYSVWLTISKYTWTHVLPCDAPHLLDVHAVLLALRALSAVACCAVLSCRGASSASHG